MTRLFFFASLGIASSSVHVALAEASLALEEVIVTAQRRETNLQDTAISITAFSENDLRARSLSSTAELAHYVPNLSITPATTAARSPNAPAVFIRGIGANDFIINSDPGVGLYVDDVYVSRATGSLLDLLDVERVEVLRGPQGTLFGKNAVGGAISVTTRKPSDKLTYEAEIMGGSYDRFEGRAYVSGPLSDKAAGKLAIAYKTRDGHGDRRELTSGNIIEQTGGNENLLIRGGISIELNEDMDLDLIADATFNRDESIPTVVEVRDSDPTQGILALYNGLVGFPAGTPITNAALNTGDRYDNFAASGPGSFGDNGLNFSDQDIYGVGATLTWDLGAVTLKSITGYRSIDSKIGSDGDGSPLPLLGSTYVLDQEQVTQELQLFGESFSGKLDWLAGVYYLHEDAQEFTKGFAADGLYQGLEALPAAVIPFAPGSVCPGPFPPNVCLGGAGNPFNPQVDIVLTYDYAQKINSYAAFGEATLQLTERLALSAGIRYTDEDKDLDVNGITRFNSGVTVVPAGTVRKTSYNAWTPRFRIEYSPQENLLAYASFSRGFKSGGINGRVFDALTLREFAPEYVWSYEGGFKADLLDQRLRLNGAVFFNDYSDLQVSIIDGTSGSINAFLTNAAGAEIYGFELEADARVNEYFDIGGSLAYLDTEITEVDPGVQDFTLGQRLQKVPEWAFTLYGEARRPLAGGYELKLRADYSHKSKYYNDAALSENLAQDAFGLLSLRLELTSPRGWTLAAFGTNVTDEDYIVYGLDGTTSPGLGVIERGYGRPAEWGVSLRYVY